MPQRRCSNQWRVCRCSAVNFGQIWFYTFFTLMIIYYIVFRTILHKHLFLHHITTSPIFTGFSNYDRGRREGRCILGIWGPFWRYWEVFLLGYWWYREWEGTSGTSSGDISSTPDSHHSFCSFFLLFFSSSYGSPREVRNSVSTFATFVDKCDRWEEEFSVKLFSLDYL